MIDLLLCIALLAGPVLIMLAVMVRVPPSWVKAAPDASAAQRAQELLDSVLTVDQRRVLAVRGYLPISSSSYPGREYHIWPSGGPVDVYDSGRFSMSLCVEPLDPLPPGDLVLMHKLMIEGREEEYLRVANRLGRASWLGGGGRRRLMVM